MKRLWLTFLLLIFTAEASAQMPSLDIKNDPRGSLLGWMIRSGKLTKKVDGARLDELLRRGEALYLDGSSRSAANLFGSLLLDPSFWDLAKTPVHDNIRYDLAGALLLEGAYHRAREILTAFIKRKPASAFSDPAFRKLIDLTLVSGQYEQSLSALGAISGAKEEMDELAYLKGRAILGLGFAEQAPRAFASISRHSRFKVAALYTMGLLALQKGDTEKATTHFCSIVHQPGSGRFTFLVSKNTLEIIDQAWLALARIRHDEGNYQRAIDTYAMIDPRSPLIETARYESAWSLFRMGRYTDSLRNLQAHLDQNPFKEDWPNARLLQGYTLLGNCFFDSAKAEFEGLVKLFSSMAEFYKAGKDPLSLRAIPRKVQAAMKSKDREVAALNLYQQVRQAVRRVLWVKSMLRKLASGMPMKSFPAPGEKTLADLRSDLSKAKQLTQHIADLRLGLSDKKQIKQLDALAAQANEAYLRAQAAMQTLMLGQANVNIGDMKLVLEQDMPRAYLSAEDRQLVGLAAKLIEQSKAAHNISILANRARWLRATEQMANWARLATIGNIDASLGRKQALEIEVQNLAQGRYPFSLFRELAEAGLIDETMEYWPYDGEGWPDEVEYK